MDSKPTGDIPVSFELVSAESGEQAAVLLLVFKVFPDWGAGQGKSMYMFSAKRLRISAFSSPARWLYPLKPGGEQKAEDVRRKTYMLFYPDPWGASPGSFCFSFVFLKLFLPPFILLIN